LYGAQKVLPHSASVPCVQHDGLETSDDIAMEIYLPVAVRYDVGAKDKEAPELVGC
jgi:hypothetical protein